MTALFGAVVVAAGAGTRLAADRPKALLVLHGTPVVRRAVDAMVDAGAAPIVVVISPGYRDEFAAALTGCGQVQLVEGGSDRTQSVRHGLAAVLTAPAVQRPAHVLIHDAARPLVPQSAIERVVTALRDGASAVVPVIGVTDSIRQVTETGSEPVDRRQLRAVQTPQGFAVDVLADAYDQVGDAVISDDAGVCERAGYPITLVDGAVESLKITYRSDLLTAAGMLEDNESASAVAARSAAVSTGRIGRDRSGMRQ